MRKEPVVTNGITWVGLDAHKKAINVAMRLPGRKEFVEWTVENEPRAVKRFARKLAREAKGSEVRCCYEAGPCGYALKRELEAGASLVCEVVAPTLIPRKPGERVKTDRRDARKLCELLGAGLLTEVHAPSEEAEAVRDLSRCREDLKDDLHRAQHRLGKWLLRRNVRYTTGKKAWTRMHRDWLRSQRFDNAVDQAVFDDYLLAVAQIEERMKTVEAKLDDVAQQELLRDAVGWLRCFRGIDTVTAVGVCAELFDFRRFASPRKLSGYLGITPSEHSSSGKPNRGAITKTGNGHVRRLLVEAAHHYRHRPGTGLKLRKRREGQPGAVIAIADKAQHRLHRRYQRLLARGVHYNKAVVAVARELAGFLWAAMNHRHLGGVAA
jgi:transposase